MIGIQPIHRTPPSTKDWDNIWLLQSAYRALRIRSGVLPEEEHYKAIIDFIKEDVPKLYLRIEQLEAQINQPLSNREILQIVPALLGSKMSFVGDRGRSGKANP